MAITLFILPAGFTLAQTVYDLDTIEADVKIVGSGSLSHIHNAVILDIDNSGKRDLFLFDERYQVEYGGQCVFGYLDFSQTQTGSVVDVAEGGYDIVIFSSSDNYALGVALATGDWNHDGVDDLALGDISADNLGYYEGGAVFVLWGGSSWQPGTVIDLGVSPPDILVMQTNLNDDADIGIALTNLDINNDGIDDLAIGARYADNSAGDGTGAVYVIYGSEDFSVPLQIDMAQNQQDLTIQGQYTGDNCGESLAAGDLNGDGIDDLVVGAGSAFQLESEWLRLGEMYAFFGSGAFPPHHLIDLGQTEADVTVLGTWPNRGFFGEHVTCGDFDGDGLDNMCGSEISYGTTESSMGAAYVINGREGFTPGTLIDLRAEMADVSYYGEPVHFCTLGNSVSAGDLNGDGIDELNLSASNSADNAEDVSGAHNIFIGTNEYPPFHVVDLAETWPTMRILADDYHDINNNAFSVLADIDGDGFDDILVGHPMADRPEGERCGEIYIFYSDGLPIDRPPRILAGPGPDAVNPPELRLWDPFYNAFGWSGSYISFLTQGYGLCPSAGDLDGDGYDEIIVGPGPGPDHPPIVLALDPAGERLWQFQAYGTPRFGVNLAAGDLDGDGSDEIVTGAGPGEVYGPHVRGWTLSGDQIVPLGNVSFLAYSTHRWGVNVACGDIDGDGYDEIVTGAGPGDVFGPHVRAWDVDGGAAVSIGGVSYLAYGTPRWGVNVSCGDIDGDGIDEIITGPGPSELFGSHVRGWNYDGESLVSIGGVNFFAFPNIPHAMGCTVACGDLDNDHVDEILTVPGPHPDNPARLKSWNYDGDTLTQIDRMSFMVFEEWPYQAGAKVAFGNFYQDPPFLP